MFAMQVVVFIMMNWLISLLIAPLESLPVDIAYRYWFPGPVRLKLTILKMGKPRT